MWVFLGGVWIPRSESIFQISRGFWGFQSYAQSGIQRCNPWDIPGFSRVQQQRRRGLQLVPPKFFVGKKTGPVPKWKSKVFGFCSSEWGKTTVDVFRNPKQPPVGCRKPCKKWDFRYQPQLVTGDGRISEPSTVCKICKSWNRFGFAKVVVNRVQLGHRKSNGNASPFVVNPQATKLRTGAIYLWGGYPRSV